MIDTKILLNAVNAQSGINPVTVITGVRYGADVVQTFNNMTFMYDPNWEYEAGNPTYPISFFFVKSMTESMTSDISAKPLLFYNSASENNDGTKSGLLNIISDNIVTKPKIYKLDVIIPANENLFQNARLNSQGNNVMSMIGASFSSGREGSQVMNVASTIMSYVTMLTSQTQNILDALLTGLYGSAISVTSILNALLSQQDYNKASLEYMWRNRRILKLKMWNGWKFKYLVIQNLEVTKTGELGDYYEATLICQEVPILTFREQKKTSLGFLSQFSSFIGKAQKTVADVFINAMTASLGE